MRPLSIAVKVAKRRKVKGIAVAAICGIACPGAATAAPNEIKVFTDELAAYGEHSLETHVNKASRAGARADNRLTPLQVMPEYSYGIWKNWEFSLQLPVAMSDNANRVEGYRAELQYVAPHDTPNSFASFQVGAPSNRLQFQRVIQNLRSAVEPYIRVEISFTGQFDEAQIDHRKIAEAFAAGEADRVAKLTREHCEHTAARLIAGLSKRARSSVET